MSIKYTTYVQRNWRPLLIALAMAVMTVITLLAIPSGQGHAEHHATKATPRELHAKDFPVDDYKLSVVSNPIDPCGLVSLGTLRKATGRSRLMVTKSWRPISFGLQTKNTCVYGNRDFTAQVDTERPWTYAGFNNSARAFTTPNNYVNRIIAISSDELKTLMGVRYGVWLFRGDKLVGAVFRVQRVFVHGRGIGPNITLCSQTSAMTHAALSGLMIEAGESLK